MSALNALGIHDPTRGWFSSRFHVGTHHLQRCWTVVLLFMLAVNNVFRYSRLKVLFGRCWLHTSSQLVFFSHNVDLTRLHIYLHSSPLLSVSTATNCIHSI